MPLNGMLIIAKITSTYRPPSKKRGLEYIRVRFASPYEFFKLPALFLFEVSLAIYTYFDHLGCDINFMS